MVELLVVLGLVRPVTVVDDVAPPATARRLRQVPPGRTFRRAYEPPFSGRRG
jgi:hypothetical protein